MYTISQRICSLFILLSLYIGLSLVHAPNLLASDSVEATSHPSTNLGANPSTTTNPHTSPALLLSQGVGQSLVPYMQYMIDPSGMLNLQELFSPAYDDAFTPLKETIPLTETGSTWLRLSIKVDSENAYVIKLGSELSSDVTMYIPEINQYINNIKQFSVNQSNTSTAPSDTINKANITSLWQEFSIPRGEALTLPTITGEKLLAQLQSHSLPIYIHMTGTPEPWFTPQLQALTDITNDSSSLIHIGITMLLAAVLVLCLIRVFTDRGQWRVWTTLFTTALLVQSLIGLPTTPHGSIGLAGLPHVLAPTLALMLLPHIARHMLRNTQSSNAQDPLLNASLQTSSNNHLDSDLDKQYAFLSIPCIFLGIVPLLPSLGWLGKLLPLWPLLIVFFLPTTIIAVVRQIKGAKLFLLGCLASIMGACCAVVAMFMDMPATIINAIPLCGTAFGALLIAGITLKHSPHTTEEKTHKLQKNKTSFVPHDNYDNPLVGDGLRLLSPDEVADGILGVVEPKLNAKDDEAPIATIAVETSSGPEDNIAKDSIVDDNIAENTISAEDISLVDDTSFTEDIAHKETMPTEDIAPTKDMVDNDKGIEADTAVDDSVSPAQVDNESTADQIAQDYSAVDNAVDSDVHNEDSIEEDSPVSPEISTESEEETTENTPQDKALQNAPHYENASTCTATPMPVSMAQIHEPSITTSDTRPTLGASLRQPLEQEDVHVLVRAEEAMRYPLESLRNTLESLQKCALNPDTQKLCLEAAAASKQLDFVGKEFQRAAYRLPTEEDSIVFDLQRCLRDAYDAVCARSDEKNVALSWFMAPHLVQTYQGDAERLRNTLRILMESAVDATDKGSVYLSARRVPESTNPGHLLFTITDTGDGGPPERRKTSAVMQAWELATSTGGSLSIDSGTHGTTISFSTRLLAIYSDNTQVNNAELQRISSCTTYGDHMISGPITGGKHGRIILGAPAASNRQLLAFYLEDTAYFADEALSNLDIMAKYTSAGAELIILDGDMPEAEISKVITTIRHFEQENDLSPVPFLALVRDEKHADILLHMGCTQTLLKPVTRSGLCAQVALLAPLVIIPPATEKAQEYLEESHLKESHPEESHVEDYQGHESTQTCPILATAFTPDMDSNTLAEAVELVTIASEVEAKPELMVTQDTAEDTTSEAELMADAHTEQSLLSDDALHDNIGDTKAVEESKTDAVPDVAPDTVPDAVQNTEEQDKLHMAASSSHNVVPTSEAEDITLRIYDEYLQNGKSTVSSSMLALDPILFTDICPSNDKKSAKKKGVQNKISDPHVNNIAIQDAPLADSSDAIVSDIAETKATIREQESAAIQHKAPILMDMEPDINAGNDGNHSNINEPIGESVSEPRIIIKKVVQNHDTQESTVFVDYEKPKTAFTYAHAESEVSAPRPVSTEASDAAKSISSSAEKSSQSVQNTQTTTQGHGQTRPTTSATSAPTENNKEVYVEEVTVGSETLRLYKMPTTSLDLDAEYAAMLEREAKYLREQEKRAKNSPKPDFGMHPVSGGVAISDMAEALEYGAKHCMDSPVASQTEASLTSLNPLTDSSAPPVNEEPVTTDGGYENIAHAETSHHAPDALDENSFKPVMDLESSIIDTHGHMHDSLEPDNIDSGNINPSNIDLSITAAHDMFEQPESFHDSDQNDHDLPDEDAESDAYDEEEQDKEPSAVARVAAALVTVCTNLREPAPLRLKEKTLPSLKNLYKAFGSTIRSTENTAVAEDRPSGTMDDSVENHNAQGQNTQNMEHHEQIQDDVRQDEIVHTTAKGTKVDSYEDILPQEQSQRFISIAQSVSEIAATIKPTASILRYSTKKDFVPQLISLLETALHDVSIAYEQGDMHTMHITTAHIADNAEALGLRNLERYARCVERAAQANDVAAACELYPDMESTVQRTIDALRHSGIDGAHRA